MKLTREQVETKLKGIFSEQLGVSEHEIKPGVTLTEDLGADSLDIVELIMATEEELEVELPDDDLEEKLGMNATFEKMVDFLFEKVKDAA